MATACRPSTSTTWSRSTRSCRRPTRRDSPVILQASRGARKYAGDVILRHMVQAAVETWPHIPVVPAPGPWRQPGGVPARDPLRLHQRDDGRLAEGGHEDAGRLRVQRRRSPGGWSRWRTRSASRSRASWGCLGSLETGEAGEEDGFGAEGTLDRDQLLTDPDQAADFVAATGVDALAIAIGTSHGAYKFTRKPTGDILAIDRIRAIHARLPEHASGDARLVLGAAGAGRTSSASTAARSRRPTASRSRRSSTASATACARSTSTPTSGSP